MVLLAVAVTIVVAIALAALYDSRAKRHGWKVGVSAADAGRYRFAVRFIHRPSGPDELPPDP